VKNLSEKISIEHKFREILSLSNSASILSSMLAVIAGLLAGFIVMLISNPANALGGFGAILIGGASNMHSMGQALYIATPILMTGLSVGFANKTGLFNIGAPGQFIVGGYAAIVVGVKCAFLPGHLHWLVALAAAMIAGAIWGAIPGILKAYRNVNEVIACIMMNYIGMYFVNYLITQTIFDSLKNQTLRVANSAVIPKMGLDLIFREGNSISSANGGIIIAIIMAIIMYVVLEKTTFGFELKACGFNRDAAKYAGINEKRSIVFSMCIAGAAAGLGGALMYLAGSGKGIDVVDVLSTEGFNGIPVALLGLNNPIGIIISALFIAYLSAGGFAMQLYNFAPQVIEIIISIIIYFSAVALLLKSVIQSIAKKETA
jgi:simple sugar transport system permease protein